MLFHRRLLFLEEDAIGALTSLRVGRGAGREVVRQRAAHRGGVGGVVQVASDVEGQLAPLQRGGRVLRRLRGEEAEEREVGQA